MPPAPKRTPIAAIITNAGPKAEDASAVAALLRGDAVDVGAGTLSVGSAAVSALSEIRPRELALLLRELNGELIVGVRPGEGGAPRFGVDSGRAASGSADPKLEDLVTGQAPFGSPSVLLEEEARDVRARRVLWNMTARVQGWPYLEASFDQRRFSEGRSSFRTQVTVKRLGAPTLSVSGEAKNRLPQIFRERILFEAPSYLKGFELLAFRFLGGQDDVVWWYSPLLGKLRQLTGSNRGDILLDTDIAADDILGWSGKVENWDATWVGEMVALIPNAPQLTAKGDGACVAWADRAEAPVGAQDDGEAATPVPTAKPTAVPALAAGTVWRAARLWQISLGSRDPYYASGRVELYVDPDRMLPMLALVLGWNGDIERIRAMSWGTLAVEGGGNAPYLGSVMSYKANEAGIKVLRAVSYMVCSARPGTVKLDGFDPRAFAPTPTPETAKRVQTIAPGALKKPVRAADGALEPPPVDEFD